MARTEFGLHPSNSGGKTAISYLGSPGNNSSSISALQQESESLIRPRNFAALSLGNDSTICSCFAALARYDLRSRRFFMTKKAKSGATMRSRDSARYLLPDIPPRLRWEARSVSLKRLQASA